MDTDATYLKHWLGTPQATGPVPDAIRAILTERAALLKVAEAARALQTRKAEGPSEDARIFAEWDDLDDVLATLRDKQKAEGNG